MARLTRAGLNLIQQALTIYDADLRLAVWNIRFQEMFDLPDRLVTPGAAFEDTIRYLAERGDYGDVGEVTEFVATRVRIARAFEPHYMERTRSNGRTISVEGSPLPGGGWVTVYTDITAIKRQEALLRGRSEQLSERVLAYSEELARANRELAASIAALEQAKRDLTEAEARTRMTAEMVPAHISHLDRSERYTYSNRRLPSVLPGTPQEIVGRPARAVLGEQAHDAIRPHIARALEGEPGVMEFTHAESGRRVRAAFTPDRKDNGPVQGVYILSMDITAETQARAALTQTRKRELAAQLTSGMAHDFANLLTIILGLQARLERLEGLPAAAREIAATTRAAAQRGGRLLDRLADISGRRDLRPAPTDMGALLADVRALARSALPEGIALFETVEGLREPILLDQGSLQDAVLNLILNARDAIGGGEGRIALRARAIRDIWVEIAVEDSGPGFSAEALEHALDPFFTTKGEAGSGLGLAMVYDAVKLAGGTVSLANQAGSGACVTLRLPLRPAPRPAEEPPLVLLVENDPDLRAGVRDMLRGLGHAVIEAESAEEARTLAGLPGVGLVLSDIALGPGDSGLALLRQLATSGHGADLRLMTALPPGDATRRTAESAFPVLPKPFDAAVLAAFLHAGDRAA
ncbi:MAG: hybrid sensor histidine kinase/response regulator [Alphaproteobacteria bacterium HGW-Alphaproteobacteria-2]|nr:MAG: hybrid sensor histidine kinase/response regulator [Alphaproteobacteria bacterium HGW-Alphaproteobacteria-2]